MASYRGETYPYQTPPELSGGAVKPIPVAIIGAGPIGLTAAIDLAQQGISCVVLDDNNVVSVGSRAICWAKRTLEIFDRLGVGARMVEKGVTWKVGRLYSGENEVYHFDLLPEAGHQMPAFINLQQYYVEQYLVERCRDFPDLIDLRWKNKVVGHDAGDNSVSLEVETPEGAYQLKAGFLLACDGARSATRQRMGLAFEGQTFEEQFLIADVEMTADFPSERWFWFDPPFHHGRSALLHKQPDNIYRIDLQLDANANADEETRPENVIPRIKAMVGDRPFKLDWVSLYKFTCAKLDRFVHGRVIFVGDSAHVVSPFGARGGNGGIQDVDNLVWKLALVINGKAPEALLETYSEERTHGSAENIQHSSRATNFMTPKSRMETVFRAQVLQLAKNHPFARKLVNSGRLSQPCSLADMRLQTPGKISVSGIEPGMVCLDAPIADARGNETWLLNLLGERFTLLVIGDQTVPDPPDNISVMQIAAPDGSGGSGGFHDANGKVADRYGTNRCYLIRPDQHVAACFENPSIAEIENALKRAMANGNAT